ncbi:MAG: hypothetical protein EP330_11780 [Deltaproteobacteria bacterium]|nr:MAG: hypothetical protein EP330_11780 [Deltaproteobacteria bacterium]
MRRHLMPWMLGGALLLAGATTAEPLRYAEDRAPPIVNPLFTTTMSEARLAELVFEGLFTDDAKLSSTPRLATGLDLAEDRMSAVVRLKPGVTWQDGESFTAEDVAFTVAAMKEESTASTERGRVQFIQEVEVIDDLTVKLTFEREEYAPEDKLHFKVLPAHRFEGTAVKRSDAFRTQPIGTGPYRVKRFNDDNSITLAKFDQYHDSTRIDEITMREVADKNYQSKLLLYESLEALVRVLPRDLATLQADRKVELYPYQTNSWWYVGFQNNRAPFDDERVREALTLLVDIDALLAPIGTGEVVSGPFVTSSPYYNHEVKRPKPDARKAAELLTAAGFAKSGDYWSRDGKPLTLKLTAQENLETAQDVVIALQSQLQSQGIKVEPTFLGTAEWKAKVWRERDFDAVLSQWSFDRSEDVTEQFHSEGKFNFGHYANAEVDALLDQAKDTSDPQAKKALLREVHAKVADDHPMIFLWTLDSYSAISRRVRKVVIHPFYFFTWSREWELK